MAPLRGILWKKLHSKKSKPKEKDKEREKPVEEEVMPEEELEKEEKELQEEEEQIMKEAEMKEEEALIREEEERMREEKIKMYRFRDESNKKKLRDMGLDVKEGKILCVVCKKWKGYTEEALMALVKRNGIDIIWKYICDKCRKDLLREKVPEEYVPEEFS